MKAFASLLLISLSSIAAAQESLPPPPDLKPPDTKPVDPPLSKQEPLQTEEKADPKEGAPEEEAPEDHIETLLDKSAKHYEKGRRAKCGGELFEAAEILEQLAAPQQKRVELEAEVFRVLALDAARGKLDAHKVDLAAALAYARLSYICQERSATAWRDSNPKQAGVEWRRAAGFLERAVSWGSFGLSAAGDETLSDGKKIAEQLGDGQPVDSDAVKKLHTQTGQMIGEVGRALAAKGESKWDEHPAVTGDSSRSTVSYLDNASKSVIRRAKTSVVKLGDLLKRWSGAK